MRQTGSPESARRGGIVIIDFGSQVTQLIARRVREASVYSEILPHTVSEERVRALAPKGVILSGGPASVYGKDAPALPAFLKALPYPTLGICYGMQLLGHELGGKVVRAHREYGPAYLFRRGASPLLQGVPVTSKVWMSHGDSVVRLPPGFRRIGRTSSCRFAAMGDDARRVYGVQFHPEVVHTDHGTTILRNFVFRVCGCRKNWTMGAFAKEAVAAIREKAAGERVLVAISGGVDSSVVAALVGRAIGPKLIGLFVDNGLLRKNEGAEVLAFLKKRLGAKVRLVDARARFLEHLEGVSDPELKRRRIGTTFIRVFEDEVRHLERVRFLAQGTLYPDVIESQSTKGPSATIKTHHNVGGLPKRMQFQLIEPLRELFKDEVRALGKELGLPRELLWRHPFPGPGLAVRLLGPVSEPRLAVLRDADAIVVDELKRSGWYDKVWQAFAVLLPVKSVGVMGDERTYADAIAIRAVTSSDGMTADWAKLPPDLLARMSSRIINEVRGVNRVVYDVSSKPPSTIEWE
jgi:GMP synthase (glutamine-hydrolysing)